MGLTPSLVLQQIAGEQRSETGRVSCLTGTRSALAGIVLPPQPGSPRQPSHGKAWKARTLPNTRSTLVFLQQDPGKINNEVSGSLVSFPNQRQDGTGKAVLSHPQQPPAPVRKARAVTAHEQVKKLHAGEPLCMPPGTPES